jgi:uncharacterized protein (TIGR03083 family)
VNAAPRRSTPLGRVAAVEPVAGPIDFVTRFAAAAERFAEAVAHCDMRAPVPTCAPWSTYDLVVHLGNVHAWAATIVETGKPAPEHNDEPASNRARAVSRWYVGKAEDLFEVLRRCPSDGLCWNFASGSGTAAFWPRRQLHETTIHQVDLDIVAGRESELAANVSADGVDEVLTVFLRRMHQRGYPAGLTRPLALTATDTRDTWLVSPPPRHSAGTGVPTQPTGETAPPTVSRARLGAGDDEAEDRLEAPAGVLHRLLWKRLPVDHPQVHVEGDPGRVAAFLASRLVP